jgi:hypothetical protein
MYSSIMKLNLMVFDLPFILDISIQQYRTTIPLKGIHWIATIQGTETIK